MILKDISLQFCKIIIKRTTLYENRYLVKKDQFRYIKIQLKTKVLSMRLQGITTEFVGFIPQSRVLTYIFEGWILIYWNWSIGLYDVVWWWASTCSQSCALFSWHFQARPYSWTRSIPGNHFQNMHNTVHVVHIHVSF